MSNGPTGYVPRNPSEVLPTIYRRYHVRYPEMINPDELASKVNFTNVCRLCATEAPEVFPLYKSPGLDHDFVGKIRKYLPIKVSKAEFMPQGICVDCANTLMSWHELTRSARIADFMLRRRLGTATPPPPPEQSPSASSGSEITKNGVKYVDVATDAPLLPVQRLCSICSLMTPAKRYNNHMINMHNSSVFRCEECHSYLDKDDLLFHMKNHALHLLSGDLKVEYYKNEQANLAEQARLEALGEIELQKVNEYIRKRKAWEQLQKRQLEEQNRSMNNQQSQKNNESGESQKRSVEEQNAHCQMEVQQQQSIRSTELQQRPADEPKRLTTIEQKQQNNEGAELEQRNVQNQQCDADVQQSQENNKMPELQQHREKEQTRRGKSNMKADKTSGNTELVKEEPCQHESGDAKNESSTEQDSNNVVRTPPKRKRIEPKCSSEADTSPTKRQRKNKRSSVAKRGLRVKELYERDDGNDGDDEVNTPMGSPSFKVVKVKEDYSEKSPKTSRTCPICGKQYRASSSYFYHMKYFHKRSREHECSVCNKKFGTKANLTQHESIHTGAYDLECKECGKRFKSKPSLYIHEQSHGGPKRWACAQCGRSFRWRTHLARHVTRHAAERAHVCATCGRGFSVRCDLLRHARTHTADEFHCATCGLKFAQKRYLQVHVAKKHPEAPLQMVTRS